MDNSFLQNLLNLKFLFSQNANNDFGITIQSLLDGPLYSQNTNNLHLYNQIRNQILPINFNFNLQNSSFYQPQTSTFISNGLSLADVSGNIIANDILPPINSSNVICNQGCSDNSYEFLTESIQRTNNLNEILAEVIRRSNNNEIPPESIQHISNINYIPTSSRLNMNIESIGHISSRNEFLELAKNFFSDYNSEADVKERFIYGLYTERSRTGIFIIIQNQVNFYNPYGYFFVRKYGRKYKDLECYTTYVCQYCYRAFSNKTASEKKVPWAKFYNSDMIYLEGIHYEHCQPISFLNVIANDVFRYSLRCIRSNGATPKIAYKNGDEMLKKVSDIFNYKLDDLKQYYGNFNDRKKTLRNASHQKNLQNKKSNLFY
uniref:FLYWCH-type domain-containing protein n=2 Tax=Parastrongyloides trichosuri TaxID=131310 RepID=A0A0N5A6R9_PARTI